MRTTTHCIAALLWLSACGSDDAPTTTPTDRPDEPAQAPSTEPEPYAPWLDALLEFDLHATPSDALMTELGEALASPVACPRPGTGCFVQLQLAGHETQIHFGEDEALQVWGPTEPMQMPRWVETVERDLDASSLTALNEPGARPDRLFRDDAHVVLLHDHSEQPCGGFCPAMIWIAPPDHPNAPGYGFGRGGGPTR